MTPDPDAVKPILLKLAALSAAIDERLTHGIRMTGASSSRTDELILRYARARDQLVRLRPDLFGDVRKPRTLSSIISQAEDLREIRSDLAYILALAERAGLLPPSHSWPPPLRLRETRADRSWLREHFVQMLIALLVAYLVFRFGWN